MSFAFLKSIGKFARESFSEPSGAGSFSRVSGAAIISSVIFWVTYLVLKNHALPDLAGPTLFLTGGTSATYGTNKVSTAISGRVKDSTTTVTSGT